MSLTLVDVATLVGILAVLNVPITLVIRASMTASFMPRESLSLHLDRIAKDVQRLTVTLDELKRDISRLQSPPVIDKLQSLIPRFEHQDKRVTELERELKSALDIVTQLMSQGHKKNTS